MFNVLGLFTDWVVFDKLERKQCVWVGVEEDRCKNESHITRDHKNFRKVPPNMASLYPIFTNNATFPCMKQHHVAR